MRKKLTKIAAILLSAVLLTGCTQKEKAESGEAKGLDEVEKVIETLSEEYATENGEFDLEKAFLEETGKGDPIRVISTLKEPVRYRARWHIY